MIEQEYSQVVELIKEEFIRYFHHMHREANKVLIILCSLALIVTICVFEQLIV